MIVHVVAAGEIGGAERMLVDLLGAATDAATGPASVALLTPHAGLRALLEGSGATIDDRGPVREHPLAFLRPGDVRWLTDVLRRRRARIVHLHTFASQLLGTRAARAVGARIVRTEHSTRVYDDPSCRPFARWTLGRADRVVFISEHVRRVAMTRMPFLASRHTEVIANGIDPDHFTVAARSPGRREGRLRLLALGRLDPRKGLDLALEALARVPEAELSIVGEGSERRRLEKQTAALGLTSRVTFDGYSSDVRGALERADAVLSSAREEGLGIALLEAMAMGRPVIAVPVGGIPEIVVDGETGWLASGRTPSALAVAIELASRDRAELDRRGQRARERVLTRFTVAAMRAKYAALYTSL